MKLTQSIKSDFDIWYVRMVFVIQIEYCAIRTAVKNFSSNLCGRFLWPVKYA
jgi:hypothetical protein